MIFLSSLSSSKLTALACYTTLAGGGADVIAMAMDDNTVRPGIH